MPDSTSPEVRRWRLTDMHDALRAIPTDKWLPIAYQMHKDMLWVEVPGAPITIGEAEALRRDGLLWKFHRREEACTAIVVTRRAA